jgi:CCR4-NOT transcription complex subunit 1
LQVCYQSAAGEVAQAEAYPDSSEALDYYQRLYAGEMSITQIIDVLKRFKISNIPGEQEIYKSMIQALFDDYKFIARYPERQLLITGVLFGSLIQNEVINAMPLGIALRYILDGLRQTYGSPLFKFSYNALLQFQNRLAEWPQYCSLLLQIDHLNQSCPDIVFFIKSLSGPKPAPPIPTVLPLESNDFFEESALNLDGILLESQFILEQPPENIQEKILFVINNLSDQTIDQKVVEISEILLPRYYRWFGNYLVVKRATIEPNYHSMYIGCVDSLQIPPLHSIILYETFAELKKMLASENILNSSKERTLLKNLGSWLGLITVAKNSPIKHRNLAFKSLLLQGYDTKRLLVVIPFVCKVLEQCHGSKVFRPPNPWLMAIMKLLSELYNFAELKLNLKFEIEVLCKNLKLDIKDITPSDLMRTRRNKAVVREKLGSNAAPQANVVGELSNSESHIATANMESFVTFNPNIVLFNSQPALKKVVQMAIDRSISDVIVSPVVERSVTIAVISTRDLVIKDFALEPSEEKLRSSAHHMAQCLAGSLASVSSREPLRASMIATLRALLNQAGFNEETVSEQMVFVIVSDNLDLACSFMERAASEKAVREIDESLALAYHNRRKHSDRSAQPFYDMAVFSASRYPSTLPEPLRLRATGLSEQQLSIYQSFENVPHALTNLLAEKAARERVETPGSFEDNNALIPTVEAADKFYEIMNEMDPIIRENPLQSFAALSSHQVIQTCIQKIVWLVSRSAKPEDSTSIFAQKILQILYRDPIDSALLVYVWLLTKLIETSPKVLNELREWFFYQEDEVIVFYIAQMQCQDLQGLPASGFL